MTLNGREIAALGAFVTGALGAARLAWLLALRLGGDPVAPALCAGIAGAWIGWLVAGAPTIALPVGFRFASWAALGEAGLLRGEGCALGAVRRHGLAPWRTLRHRCGHRLVVGTGVGADTAFLAAASSWSGALIVVDTRGTSARLDRDDVVRFAPGRADGLRLNPLLLIRRGSHAWRDASILAASLVRDGAAGDGAAGSRLTATLAAVLLDTLHTAPPVARTLDGVRRRLLDPARLAAEISGAVHEADADGVWRAHPDIARMARVWRADPDAARADFVAAERALRLFQDGRLMDATAALDLRLADAAVDGPTTIVLEAPPGDGARFGSFIATLLGQLVAHLTDAVETDAFGRPKARRVLLAIDDAAALGRIPLLAQRLSVAVRCRLELLLRADSVAQALATVGEDVELAAFDAVVAVGPQDAASTVALSPRAGTRPALELRPVANGWTGAAPTVAWTRTPVVTPRALHHALANAAHVLIAGLKPLRCAIEAPSRRGLRLRDTPPAPPAHDWTGAAAPAPVRERRVRGAQAPAALPLFEAETAAVAAGEANVPAVVAEDAVDRLRRGLARGGKTRR